MQLQHQNRLILLINSTNVNTHEKKHKKAKPNRKNKIISKKLQRITSQPTDKPINL